MLLFLKILLSIIIAYSFFGLFYLIFYDDYKKLKGEDEKDGTE